MLVGITLILPLSPVTLSAASHQANSDTSNAAKRLGLIRQAEAIMEDDPPFLPVAWENINDVRYNYVKGHNPAEYFGVYDIVRLDTIWLDKS
jgi:hypothetical protein